MSNIKNEQDRKYISGIAITTGLLGFLPFFLLPRIMNLYFDSGIELFPATTQMVTAPTRYGWLAIFFIMAFIVYSVGMKINRKLFEVSYILILALIIGFIFLGLIHPIFGLMGIRGELN